MQPLVCNRTAACHQAYTCLNAGHEHPVSALDWDHPDFQLVSCGHDRNAYVWTHSGFPANAKLFSTASKGSSSNGSSGSSNGSSDRSTAAHMSDLGYSACGGEGGEGWYKQMVLTRLKRACLAVRWSPCKVRQAHGAEQLMVACIVGTSSERGIDRTQLPVHCPDANPPMSLQHLYVCLYITRQLQICNSLHYVCMAVCNICIHLQKKMAIGSSSKAVAVAFYDPELRVWTPKVQQSKFEALFERLHWEHSTMQGTCYV